MEMTHQQINPRYRLLNPLGSGGMGTVYRAYDRLHGQHIALKQVTAPTGQLGFVSRASTDASLTLSLANEFRTLASLRHPHIISVLDYGFTEDRQPYFTMPILEEALPIDEMTAEQDLMHRTGLVIQILQALTYLHRRGIIHRDLKPANVLVQDEHVYLLDFGLALDASFAQKEKGDSAGTLAYLAPELLRGHTPSVASDLYAVGVIAYEVFVGQHPYNTDNLTELIQDILLKPLSFSHVDIDDDLKGVLQRLLAKTPDDRYTSSTETIQALCRAMKYPLPKETDAIRESFLQAASFVGRKGELQLLTDALDKTMQGEGSAWLIGGESGVGKSRLIDELRTRALVRGAQVLRGQAVTNGGLAYQLFRDILPHLLLQAAFQPDEVAVLSQVLPNVQSVWEDPLPPINDPLTAQQQLPLLIVDAFQRVASRQTVVVLLEDLQWAGDDLELLKQIIPLCKRLPLLIIGNYRNDDCPELPEQLPTMAHIELKRFSDAEIQRLSVSMLGEIAQKSAVQELIQTESEGNAFFIVEVVRALAEESGSLSNIGFATLPPQVFAGGVQKLVQRRLAKLPEWARTLVNTAAVIGRQIDQQLIHHLFPNVEVAHWLSVCEEAAVFIVEAEQWQFAHDKLREGVLRELYEVEKRKIHLSVANAIEAVYTSNLSDYTIVLAEHYAAAQVLEKEAQYVALAADLLVETNPSESKRYAERAIELNAHEQVDNPMQRLAELNFRMGQATCRLSEFDASREWLQKSRDLYAEAGDDLGVAKANNVIGELGLMTGQFDGAIPLIEMSLQTFEQEAEWLQVGYALMNLGVIHAHQGKKPLARDYFERCLATMQKTNNEFAITQAMNNLAIIYDMQADYESAITFHQQALAIRRRIKDKHGIAFSLANLAAIDMQQGRYERAHNAYQEALQLLQDLGDRRSEADIYDALGNLAMKQKDFVRALTNYQQAQQIARDIGDKRLLSQVLVHQGHASFELGMVEQVNRLYLDALANARDINLKRATLDSLYALAKLRMQQGDRNTALQWYTLIQKHGENYDLETTNADIEMLKGALPAHEFEAHQQAGHNLDLHDVVDNLLHELEQPNG